MTLMAWLLVVHLAITIVCSVLRGFKILKADVPALIIMACIPFWGEIMFLVMEHAARTTHESTPADELDVMHHYEVKRPAYLEYPVGELDTVPLEDMLMLGNMTSRREALMNVLLQDAEGNIYAIHMAMRNEDPDIVHYATSALMEVSTRYDQRLQKMEDNYRVAHGSRAALDSYITLMKEYLESGIATGTILTMRRKRYQELLQVRINRFHERDDYAALAESLLDSEDYEQADQQIIVLQQRWPDWPTALSLRVRYLYETNQGAWLTRLLENEARKDYLPRAAHDFIKFWGEGEA